MFVDQHILLTLEQRSEKCSPIPILPNLSLKSEGNDINKNVVE